MFLRGSETYGKSCGEEGRVFRGLATPLHMAQMRRTDLFAIAEYSQAYMLQDKYNHHRHGRHHHHHHTGCFRENRSVLYLI